MSFLEDLIQAKPPLKPFVDAETNLNVFISLLWPKVHFLKVTRVVTLAPPHEVHPYHSTERRYLPSWRSYQNKSSMECLIYFGMTSMKEGTSAQLSGRGELHGGG